MKVISDKAVKKYLEKHLDCNTILEKFQPALLSGLAVYAANPEKIIPPRVVQLSNNANSDTTHLFMPCISPSEVGIKVISGGPGNNSKGLGFQGCMLILDEITGSARAIMNANTSTAFRTALASTLGLSKVIKYNESKILPELTVFGVGPQAYWHLKLTLIIYKESITSVNIMNRTLKNAEILATNLKSEFPSVQFNSYSYNDDDDLEFVPHIQNSSIIFGCTPSTNAVIKNSYINKDSRYPKFISLIGSYKPNMIELDLDFIKSEFKDTSIIVDSKEHTLQEAGELIQADISESQLIDIVELYNLELKDASKYTSPSNVILQKIVGLSIMDLSIGKLIAEDITSEDAVIVDEF
ncbi:uncharacterized protein RJT21DRAFT_15477 [Scheffersomyces amazonensis]|uniref:uncharacterized protein n=1 Tax=Scheffersomyces amazonensis TaxID=1078765 RepID=UPI00315DB6D1